MAENKEYITQQENTGSILISEDVVASIATAAALETEGVSAMLSAAGDLKPSRKMSAKGVVIEPEDDGLRITLYVMIRYGYVLAEVAGKVQKTVLAALQDMTGFTIRSVNVMIGGICFD